MSPRLTPKAPQCLSCLRRILGPRDSISFPARQQVRGKKKLASEKVSSVNVQLLKNVSGYGRMGSIVPVTSGVMRNIWFPKKIAAYVTSAKLNELGKRGTIVERDPNYRIIHERPAEALPSAAVDGDETPPATLGDFQASVRDEAPSVPVELPLLEAEQGTEIISKLLPPKIEFYRTPVPIEQLKPQTERRISPSIPTTSAVSAAAAEAVARQTQEPEVRERGWTSIYGSVSTSDIAANLKAILAEDEQGLRVVLSPENISFIDETEDYGRVKQLGEFDIEIRLDGAVQSVRRIVTVRAQE